MQNGRPYPPAVSFRLRMILSENRFPSPIGVEDMLFGIMRRPTFAPVRALAQMLGPIPAQLPQETVKIAAGQSGPAQANGFPIRPERMPDGRAAAK